MTASIESTPIPGLLVLRLDVRADTRGWFKENWQRQKMVALGLPDFEPVQNNISYNLAAGTTRGIHAEPWDKFVSVGAGRAFGAWVDLREGASFGAAYTIDLTPEVAVFVPRGVGNAFQTLEDGTCYTYLVNDHWRPDATYPALALDDPTVSIAWPIPLSRAEVSDKDRTANPRLADVAPMPPKTALVVGASGQLGAALASAFPGARAVDRAKLDLTDEAGLDAWPWSEYDVVFNAGAWTAVDDAEDERRSAWAANAIGPAHLARLARHHRFTLVHYSTDYVFDGTSPIHVEDEPLSPLGVYGQSKAAGELAVATTPRHYLLRTSWLVGHGSNFVRTMARLADAGARPRVVDDQIGRLTFADELARATQHLVTVGAPFGTYHVSNGGPSGSWADVARAVFGLRGRDPDDVTPVSTKEYVAGNPAAARPAHSTFDLTKLESTGYEPADWRMALEEYVVQLPNATG